MLKPIRLVTICASQDESHLSEWDMHLSALKYAYSISHFHSRSYSAGEPLVRLDEALANADLCACLLSANFLSDEISMSRAYQAINHSGIIFLPVRLRAVDLKGSPFGRMAVVPAEPVLATPKKVDGRYLEAVCALRRVLEKHEDQTPVGFISKGLQNAHAERDKPPPNRTRLRAAKRALFIILLWEKSKEVWSSTIGKISGSLVAPSITKSILLVTGLATVVSVVIHLQQPARLSGRESGADLPATPRNTRTQATQPGNQDAEKLNLGEETLLQPQETVVPSHHQKISRQTTDLGPGNLIYKAHYTEEKKLQKIQSKAIILQKEQATSQPPDTNFRIQPPVDTTTSLAPPQLIKTPIPTVSQSAKLSPEIIPVKKNSDDEESLLTQAEAMVGFNKHDEAIELARKVIDKSSSKLSQTRAWRIIGEAACGSRNSSLASAAYNEVDFNGKQSIEWTCRQAGMNIGNPSGTTGAW